MRNLRLFGARAFGLKLQFDRQARENVFLLDFELLQLRGGIFEFFVFDELTDQFPTRILPFLFALDLHLLLHGQQFAALDIHQRRGHDEEFAGDLQVQQAHRSMYSMNWVASLVRLTS